MKKFDAETQNLYFQIFDFLRVPFIIFVIFIHINAPCKGVFQTGVPVLSEEGIYNLMVYSIQSCIALFAVPSFFVISGFLSFRNIEKWDWSLYREKTIKRVCTLIIPYIIWILLIYALHIAKMTFDCIHNGESIQSVVSFIIDKHFTIFFNYKDSYPYIIPLWFLRDLIYLNIITPIIYFFIKRLKLYWLLPLIIYFVYAIYITQGFFLSHWGIIFFSTGAYLGLNKIDFISFLARWQNILIPTYIGFLILVVLTDPSYIFLKLFFVCFSIAVAFCIGHTLVKNHGMKFSRIITSSCFFVYALHGAPLPERSLVKKIMTLLNNVIPGDAYCYQTIRYLITPFMVFAVCVILMFVLNRICPRLAAILSGRRNR